MKNEIDKSKDIAKHLVSVMLDEKTEPNANFDEWMKESPSAGHILDELTDEALLHNEIDNYSTVDKNRSAQRLLQKIAARRRRGLFVKIISGAAALIAISFVVYFLNSEVLTPQVELVTVVEESAVRLIIDEQEEVFLDGDTVTSSSLKLHKRGENEVAFTKINNSAITKNRLVTPSKEKFTINLSDGTKVTLNARSELIFPSEFSGDTREVTIRGEAFFEVVKDNKRPFIVHCDTIAIEVYGTVFNVNSRGGFTTFLCEGSIGVTINKESKQMLTPNQLITINNGISKIETLTNGDKYIDWTTGYFIFDGDKIERVIKKISEWYDIELLIDKGNNNAIITGSFERSLKLDDIIKSIEEVSGVKLYKKEQGMR